REAGAAEGGDDVRPRADQLDGDAATAAQPAAHRDHSDTGPVDRLEPRQIENEPVQAGGAELVDRGFERDGAVVPERAAEHEAVDAGRLGARARAARRVAAAAMSPLSLVHVASPFESWRTRAVRLGRGRLGRRSARS